VKGLILSGGFGERLRPLTYSQQKQLIPVANKPILLYCIEDLINAGIKSIGIIVGPNREQVMDTVRAANPDADIEFIYQEFPGGLAHAVKTGESFLGDDNFIMYLGDNLLKGGINEFVSSFSGSQAAASLLLTTTEHPERFGMALVDEQKNVITKLAEKQKQPLSNLIIVGIYGLTPIIFEAISNLKPSWRNELEITDALQWLIDNGYSVQYGMVEGWWKDTGLPEDILEANRLVLDDIATENKGKIKDSQITGAINIGEGSSIESGSRVQGPVVIGQNCVISKARIGPNTSIGNNCHIINTEIENSIIMENSKITNAGKIVDSLIGNNVDIARNDDVPVGTQFIIGDSSKVKL